MAERPIPESMAAQYSNAVPSWETEPKWPFSRGKGIHRWSENDECATKMENQWPIMEQSSGFPGEIYVFVDKSADGAK
ncbi:MAG: hypothetical protein IT350_15535 [Deltaproteobacteria bacterium]|nr:hypothetical protein [Deltaproteobacteria bacterium]